LITQTLPFGYGLIEIWWGLIFASGEIGAASILEENNWRASLATESLFGQGSLEFTWLNLPGSWSWELNNV